MAAELSRSPAFEFLASLLGPLEHLAKSAPRGEITELDQVIIDAAALHASISLLLLSAEGE